jgi:RimJ/RimL family protein N-acetyltransferase
MCVDEDMLEGRNICLRIMELEDVPLIVKWANDPDFAGEFEPLEQVTLREISKWLDGLASNEKWFFILKKDGSEIGQIMFAPIGRHFVIGYRMRPEERNKGYCTEAVQIIVDYLFLTRDIVRIQAETNPRNLASRKVLEKAGFTEEGVRRKSVFIRGKWHDGVLYSILREDWLKPKILTRFHS